MKYKYLVKLDKAEIWERHSDISYVGLFDSNTDALNYIKTKRDFEKHTITKIPVEPKPITSSKIFADFGYKMIYNLKTQTFTVGTRALYPISLFNNALVYSDFDSKLYDISIVIPKKRITKPAIDSIENSKQQLIQDIVNSMNSILFEFYKQNLIECTLGEDGMEITVGIKDNPKHQTLVTSTFGNFAIFGISTELRSYLENPTPARLVQAYYKIIHTIT